MDISDVFTYFSYYSDEAVSGELVNWFCRVDNSFYSSEQLFSFYVYKSEDQIAGSGNFVRIDKVDIISEERRFMEINYPNELKRILRDSTDDFGVQFNMFLDHNDKYSEWYKYKKSVLLKAFDNWKKANGISLRLSE